MGCVLFCDVTLNTKEIHSRTSLILLFTVEDVELKHKKSANAGDATAVQPWVNVLQR